MDINDEFQVINISDGTWSLLQLSINILFTSNKQKVFTYLTIIRLQLGVKFWFLMQKTNVILN